MEFARSVKTKRGINLTSLIDIIFLLVVFFLLTSKFVTAEIVDLTLSTISSGKKSTTPKESLIVILEPKGKFLLSGKEYALSELKTQVEPLIKDNKDKDIVLVGKKGVTVQDMITAMDEIKASGASNISLSDSSL